MMRAAYGPDKHTVPAQEKHQALLDMQKLGPALIPHFGQDV